MTEDDLAQEIETVIFIQKRHLSAVVQANGGCLRVDLTFVEVEMLVCHIRIEFLPVKGFADDVLAIDLLISLQARFLCRGREDFYQTVKLMIHRNAINLLLGLIHGCDGFMTGLRELCRIFGPQSYNSIASYSFQCQRMWFIPFDKSIYLLATSSTLLRLYLMSRSGTLVAV